MNTKGGIKEITVSYYVAECMEFTALGEYYEGLNVSEAVKRYRRIPSERMHGVKGIGFKYHSSDDDVFSEMDLPLVNEGSVDEVTPDLLWGGEGWKYYCRAIRDLSTVMPEIRKDNPSLWKRIDSRTEGDSANGTTTKRIHQDESLDCPESFHSGVLVNIKDLVEAMEKVPQECEVWACNVDSIYPITGVNIVDEEVVSFSSEETYGNKPSVLYTVKGLLREVLCKVKESQIPEDADVCLEAACNVDPKLDQQLDTIRKVSGWKLDDTCKIVLLVAGNDWSFG